MATLYKYHPKRTNETHFSIDADNRGECEIYTDDPVWQKRLLRWFEPYKTSNVGMWFRVPTSLVIRESALVNGNERLKRTLQSVEVALPHRA